MVVFPQLTQQDILRIVDLMISKVDERLKDRDMGIELSQSAKELLSKKGYDPVLGARPLRRTIQREIEDTLSEKILFGELRPPVTSWSWTPRARASPRPSPSAVRRSRHCPTSRRSSRPRVGLGRT